MEAQINDDNTQIIGSYADKYFQMNHASICGTMITAFVLDAIVVNTALHSALSNDIVAENPELLSGCKFLLLKFKFITNLE